jgi:hypothetical protein
MPALLMEASVWRLSGLVNDLADAVSVIPETVYRGAAQP